MAIAIFLYHMCLALRASGLWLRYATLQNLIPSFPLFFSQARLPVRPGIPGQRVPPVDGVAQGERDRQWQQWRQRRLIFRETNDHKNL